MKKGLFALLIAMLLSNGALFAAGQQEAVSTEPEVEETLVLNWTAYQKKPVEQDAYLIKYYEEKFNVDVNYINIDNTKADEILGIKFAAGEIPDIFSTGAGNRFEKLQQYYDLGVIAEIPMEMVMEHAPNYYKAILKDVPGSP